MFRLLTIQILRNKTAMLALLISLGVGLASIYTGKAFVQKQHKAIEATARYQQEHIKRLVKYENKEFGLLMYYLKFGYVNKPLPLTALAIGQRDVNTSIQSLTIRGLEAQKYDTDLQNPFNLMMGNMDLSFVIVYIFPLLIITLTFNVLSEEKEKGTWSLIYAQSRSPKQYLLQKVTVTGAFVMASLLVLFMSSVLIVNIQVDKVFCQFMLISFLYLLFWFVLVVWIVSLNQKSSVNAIALLGCWLLLTIILPAAANGYITTKYAVPEALSTMLKQRDGYHRKWDLPKQQTIQQFYRVYPHYQHLTWQHEGFDWLWYYAMQHCGDIDAGADRQAFMQKLQQRNMASNTAAWFMPCVNVQLQHNELAQSGLSNHLSFLDSTTVFHERQRQYFYPKIFEAKPVLQEDWSKHQLKYHSQATASLGKGNILSMLILISLFMCLSWQNIKRTRLL